MMSELSNVDKQELFAKTQSVISHLEGGARLAYLRMFCPDMNAAGQS